MCYEGTSSRSKIVPGIVLDNVPGNVSKFAMRLHTIALQKPILVSFGVPWKAARSFPALQDLLVPRRDDKQAHNELYKSTAVYMRKGTML